MRTNPEVISGDSFNIVRRETKKQLDDTYQTLREVVKPNPYPNMESFRTIFKDVSDRIPAAKSADPREFVDIRFI